MEVYLDNSATTCVDEEVAELMYNITAVDDGDPSSMHNKGCEAEKYLRNARDTFASILKVSEKEIYFTSGGTESDNTAIIGAAMANKRRGNHIITTAIEHPAVHETTDFLSKNGFEITYLPVNEYGCVEPDELKKALKPETILVTIMYVNNEIGSVMPIKEIGEAIKEYNKDIIFHVDAVQAFGKYKIYPYKEKIDLMSISSHKIHGPKGVGVLFVKDKTRINPIVFGGGQQKGMRSGTENVPGIAGMALAARKLYDSFDEDVRKMYELKEYFVRQIMTLDDVVINGYPDERSAPHVVSVSFEGITKSEVLLHALEEKGIYVSSGSACASNKPAISDTLTAIGVKRELLTSTIRFSFSVYTTVSEIDYTINELQALLPVLRKYRPK